MKTFQQIRESVTELGMGKQKKEKFAKGQRVRIKGTLGKDMKRAGLPVQGKIVSIEPLASGDVMLLVKWQERVGMGPTNVLGSKVKVKK